MGNYEGVDNYGRPKAAYLEKLSAMTDAELNGECYSMIYQSSLCANNPRADWHWMVNACYEESDSRTSGAPIYSDAFRQCYADHAG